MCSESLEGPLEEYPHEATDEGGLHPNDVQEAIDGFRSLKSTLQKIPDLLDNPENPDALVGEYQKVKENLLDQLGAEPQDDAQERQRLIEDVVNNVKEQLGRLTEGSEKGS